MVATINLVEATPVRHLAEPEYTCWNPMDVNISFYSPRSPFEARMTTSGTLRIAAHHTSAFNSSPDRAKINEYLSQALRFWSSALRAKNPLSDSFLVQRQCNSERVQFIRQSDGIIRAYCVDGCRPAAYCYTELIPPSYLDRCREIKDGVPIMTGLAGEGVLDTDILVLVDAQAAPACSNGVLAFATVCQVDSVLNRPVMGYMNICPQSVDVNYPNSNTLKYTLLHELAHVLGFTPLLYAFMRDESGEPRTPRNPATQLPNLGRDSASYFIPSDSVITTVERTWMSAAGTFRRKIKVLRTPALLAAAREHFNCPTLDGVDLENQGGPGTSSSHFEKRLTVNELMSGSIGENQRVSTLTLSYFKDSGWYHVDMTKADSWDWGKNLGCEFVTKSCFEYMRLRKDWDAVQYPWCTRFEPFETRCLIYENAYGRCNLRKFSNELLPEYQHIPSVSGMSNSDLAHYGGQSQLADHCAYIQRKGQILNYSLLGLLRCALIMIQIHYGLSMSATMFKCQAIFALLAIGIAALPPRA
ncbi:unnamed protein product [Calicophoron daubneyi]|uniref:Leishmanolysin-like peptidase n=1 Tax=Calicophoron daubneyi TaxID=300641 RepID=A0AAV2SZX2_CALDB